MKLKLLAVVWLLTCGLGFGQVFESFEGTPPPPGWSYNSVTHGTNNPRTGSRCATFNGSNDAITSPLVSNPNSLSFYYRRSTNTTVWSAQIDILDDSDNIIANLASITSATTIYQEYIADLSSYNNIKVRITDTRSSGTAERYIDDFEISVIVGPTIIASPTSLTNLDYIVGNGPSAEQTFTVSGTNLTNDISLTAPANFEISTTTGGGFGPNITLPQTGGDVVNTTIYTRLVGGLANGNYTGNINATSTGATAQNVAVSGTVIADVLITEIMYNTTGLDDEWIEICNFSGIAQDISNYVINVNSGFYTFTFPASVVIPNNGCITVSIGSDGNGVFNNGDGSINDTGCPFVPDYGIAANVEDSNNLPNTPGPHTISLFAANGTSLANAVAYSGNDSPVNTSMHVVDSNLDNSSTAFNWVQVGNGGSPGTFSLISPCAVPNLIVRGDIASFPTISGNGSNTPLGTDNTLFAGQTIGNSQSKTFRIANEGTLPLTITSITIGGTNQGDFTITQMPSFNLAAGTFDILEITFSPTAAGQRNATVTVASNDPDTPSYEFNIRGTGICAITSASISPTAGVTGTNVTLTGENFGSLTTVNFRGIAVIPTIISATQLTFEIPSGVGSGVVTFTNDIGCQGKVNLEVITNTISACEGTAGTTPTELFISKVTDATVGGLVYIEIFNGTGSVINLGGYSVQFFNNGSSTQNGSNINLNAVDLTPGNVYVLRVGSVINCTGVPGADGSLADQSFGSGGLNFGPGTDDHIRLYNGPTNIDSWGAFENDNWSSNLGIGGGGVIFSRIGTASLLPNTTFNLSDWNYLNWNNCSDTDYSSIGSYDFSQGAPPTVSTPVLSSTNCLQATIAVTATEGFVGGNPITYQWFALAPGDTTWTALTDIGVYTGTDSNTLIINNTFNLNNYQYYCEVRENTATCSQASDAVRIEIEQTTWNGTAWNPAPPAANTLAIIDGSYNTGVGGIQSSFSACNLIINSGTVNIANGDFIEVYNNVTVETNGEIIVQTQGAFIQRGIGVNAGTFNVNGSGLAQVNKLTSPLASVFSYTYWSSPVADADVDLALFFANPFRRFYFNANNFNSTLVPDIDDEGDDWTNATGTGIMIPGRGYAATQSSIGFVAGNQYQYEFVGAFNTGDISYPLAYNPINTDHWNLVGNPYPSAIDVDELFSANSSIKEAVYLWSHFRDPLASNPGNEVLNFNRNDYLVINETAELGNGSDLNNDGVVDGLDIPDRTIPSGQSFFVSSTSANPIVFNNAMRISGNNSNDDFYRSVGTSNTTDLDNKLWINLNSDNGVYSQTVIGYVENATYGNDGMRYDARRNEAIENAAIIYTLINNDNSTKFAIQGRAKTDLNVNEIIPLGFKSNLNLPTIYTIKAIKFQGEFLENNAIYLKDNLLNITHNLTASDYLFTSEIGTFNNRFQIIFNRQSLSIGDENLTADGLSIIELPNGDVQFIVSQQHQIKEITIVDLMSRVVYQLKGNHHTETYNLSQLSKAAYIAKVTLANGQTLHKKAIKRF